MVKADSNLLKVVKLSGTGTNKDSEVIEFEPRQGEGVVIKKVIWYGYASRPPSPAAGMSFGVAAVLTRDLDQEDASSGDDSNICEYHHLRISNGTGDYLQGIAEIMREIDFGEDGILVPSKIKAIAGGSNVDSGASWLCVAYIVYDYVKLPKQEYLRYLMGE